MFQRSLAFLFVAAALSLTLPSAKADDLKFQISGAPHLGLSLRDASLFATLGGPSVKAELGDFALGFSFYPSLRLPTDGKTAVSPVLGAGPNFGYQKLIVAAPTYYLQGLWHVSLALGWKL